MRIEQALQRPSGLRFSLPVSVILHILFLLLAWKVANRVVEHAPVIIDLVFSEPQKEPPPPPPKPQPKLWPEPSDVTPLQEPPLTKPLRDRIPDEEINPLLPRNGNPRALDDLRPTVATMRRSDIDTGLPGLRISGVRPTDDGTSTFKGVPHGVDRKTDVKLPDDGLTPHFGTGNKGMRGGREGGTGDGSGDRNYFKPRPATRTDLGNETVFHKPIAPKKEAVAVVTQDVQGQKWRKIENVGPLAHLNAQCYQVPRGNVIYYQEYKFRCADNQIIEAWLKE